MKLPRIRRAIAIGRARRRINRKVGLWYHKDYIAPCLARTSRVFDLNVYRSDLIIGSLVHERLISISDVRTPEIASFTELQSVHSGTYLESTTHPETLSSIFGLDISEVKVEEILTAQRRAVAGTVAAAMSVAFGDLKTAFNLGGGFHHAEPDKGGGFCVYNDIAVAIAKLREQGFLAPIAIVDLDYHEGNGNVMCLSKSHNVIKYSVHGSVWSDNKIEDYYPILLPPGTTDKGYLNCLEKTLLPLLSSRMPKLIFYVAGNDVLDADRLGEFRITPKGLLSRDKIVVKAARKIGAKLVVTMGGGYSSASWQCTANFIRYVLTDQVIAKDSVEPELRERFNQIAKDIGKSGFWNLGSNESDEIVFSESDLVGGLTRAEKNDKILGYYSQQGIEFVFEQFGIFERLRQKGFTNLRVAIDASDISRQTIKILGRKSGLIIEGSEQVLGELVMKPLVMQHQLSLRLLAVEWLNLKDPTSTFSRFKPKLPGQTHPGLGIAEHIQELLVQVCQHRDFDGVHSIPSHYHNALIESRWFRFLDPILEGKFLAFRHVLGERKLSEASSLVENGRLVIANGTQVIKWQPSDHVLPVSEKLKGFFDSNEYNEASIKECNRLLESGLTVQAASVFF